MKRRAHRRARSDGRSALSWAVHNSWPPYEEAYGDDLRNTLIFVVTVTAILSFRLFDQVWVMTRGGPQNSIVTMLLHMGEVGFGEQRIAQGSSIAVVFFLIMLAITLVQRAFIREEREIA